MRLIQLNRIIIFALSIFIATSVVLSQGEDAATTIETDSIDEAVSTYLQTNFGIPINIQSTINILVQDGGWILGYATIPSSGAPQEAYFVANKNDTSIVLAMDWHLEQFNQWLGEAPLTIQNQYNSSQTQIDQEELLPVTRAYSTVRLYSNMDTFIQSNQFSNRGSTRVLAIGDYINPNFGEYFYNSRALIRFDTPPTKTSYSNISSVRIGFWHYGSNPCNPNRVGVYRITGGWGETTVWPGPSYNTTLLGYIDLPCHNGTPTHRSFTLYSSQDEALVDNLVGWNGGIMLKAVNDGNGVVVCSRNSDSWCTSSMRPYMDISYELAAPTWGSVSRIDQDSIRVDWNGQAGPYYQVNRSTNNSNWTNTLGTYATEYTYNGLDCGTLYYWRVRASSGGSYSPWTSSRSGSTANCQAESLVATAISANTMSVDWSNVPDATSYRIERSTNGSTWTTVATSVTTSDYSDTISADIYQTCARRYYYRVWPNFSNNRTTSYSVTVSDVLDNCPAPDSVNNFRVISATQNALTWQWTNVADDATNLRFGYAPTGTTLTTHTLAASNTTASMDNLKCGKSYTAQMQVYRSFPPDNYSSIVSTIDDTANCKSLSLSVSGTGQNTMSIDWPDFPDAVSYILQRSTDDASWITLNSSIAVSSYSDTISANPDDTCATRYYYRVLPNFSETRGRDYSNSASDVTFNCDPPSAPENLVITHQTESSIEIQWTNVADDGDGTQVQIQPTDGAWSSPVNVIYPATNYVFNSLTCGPSYNIRIRTFRNDPPEYNSAYTQISTTVDCPADIDVELIDILPGWSPILSQHWDPNDLKMFTQLPYHYDITLKNIGTESASSVQMTVVFNHPIVFDALPTGCTKDPQNNTTIDCNLGDVGIGSSSVVRLTVYPMRLEATAQMTVNVSVVTSSSESETNNNQLSRSMTLEPVSSCRWADTNNDGRVDSSDNLDPSSFFKLSFGDANFSYRFDWLLDGTIDIADVQRTGGYVGCP